MIMNLANKQIIFIVIGGQMTLFKFSLRFKLNLKVEYINKKILECCP